MFSVAFIIVGDDDLGIPFGISIADDPGIPTCDCSKLLIRGAGSSPPTAATVRALKM